MGVPHRILCEDDDNRWWPYPTSPERIQYLADARNRVLEPLQSDNATIRLPSYDSYTKVVFLNDIRFTYQSIVRLLATRLDGDASKPGEYDLACGMDFGASGLYDTWVARDICGTPMRAFWPFVRDKLSVQRIIEEKPLEVATCWNGVVAFPSGPYLYRPKTSVRKRGWKMVDDDRVTASPDHHESIGTGCVPRQLVPMAQRSVEDADNTMVDEDMEQRSTAHIGAPARCPILPGARQRGWGASG
ncbi:hypothetical protein IAR55_006703 [Kwoniella newhampshirensis]|uniref:Uncharacterized protein n=1 Tax=Kwoniella newhampshirensis TaxID=1651941 RepID=A0AAW0YFC7_9TREE